jgi:hypothetical protein
MDFKKSEISRITSDFEFSKVKSLEYITATTTRKS